MARLRLVRQRSDGRGEHVGRRRVGTPDETAAHFSPTRRVVIVNGLEMGGLRPSAGIRAGIRSHPHRLSNECISPLISGSITLLDGTPVLTRWLDITNTSKQPLALTTCIPWCGRLWSGESPVTLGHSLRWEHQWEGWFGGPLSSRGKTSSRTNGAWCGTILTSSSKRIERRVLLRPTGLAGELRDGVPTGARTVLQDRSLGRQRPAQSFRRARPSARPPSIWPTPKAIST